MSRLLLALVVAVLTITHASADPAYMPDQVPFEGSIALGNGLRLLEHDTGSEGQWNTAIGQNALLNARKEWAQTAIGYNALRDSGGGTGPSGTGVFGNTAVGYNSMVVNFDGYDNTAVGVNTLLNNYSGNDNSAFGINALKSNRSGFDNTAIGYDSLMYLEDGFQNSALGGMAGRFLSDGFTAKKAGTNSIYIGFNVRGGPVDDVDNEIVIGTTANGGGANTVVLGNTSIVKTFLRGTVLANGAEVGFRDRLKSAGPARGMVFAAGADVTILPQSAGVEFAIYNDSNSPITILQGSGVTLRQPGIAYSSGNRVLGPFQMAECWFVRSNEAACRIS